MQTYKLTNQEARQFILLKQGLIGPYRFKADQGVYDYVKQAGCVQFDPIDVCGKNAELVFQSRVKDFDKDMLYKLLYKERKLIDHFDKNMAIFPIEDWIYFSYNRTAYGQYQPSKIHVEKVEDQIKQFIEEKGYGCSKDFDHTHKVNWAWGDTSLSRAALESLYYRGELVIHHKKGTIKQYALAKDIIPELILNTENPNQTIKEQIHWSLLRRIGSVGLLWNKPSDALLGIVGLTASIRKIIFDQLIQEDLLIEIAVEGQRDLFYCLKTDQSLLEEILEKDENGKSVFKPKRRLEFIAPLDNLIWDRKLIRALFNFDYKWEIYTPLVDRKYAYYVLPILLADQFIGRIEMLSDKKNKTLLVKNVWFETEYKTKKKDKELLVKSVWRFAKFNRCEQIEWMIKE